MEIWLFNLQHTSGLKALPRQRISNIFIYLYVSYQSVYTGSEQEQTKYWSYVLNTKRDVPAERHAFNFSPRQKGYFFSADNMRFQTMWYVRPAKAQTSLRIRAVWSEHLLVAWIFYDC